VTEVRDAATVMLVRDRAGSMEVFMLLRNPRSAFIAGAHVFPGGAVDEADRHADLAAVCGGRSEAEASAVLGIPSGGLAYWVAAVRESFEEAGVLLARTADGEVVRFDDPSVEARFAIHREDVDRGRRRLVDVCVEEGLVLDVDAIHYFGHWITPPGLTRRYDTRFFVARAPAAQVPLHDDREAVDHLWVRPADALALGEEGELELILPTIRNLVAISRFERADDLLAAAAASEGTIEDEGGRRILLPDEVVPL
jgi:8-oxo-dGTP pyrophosphatase MutT (NUDIX family)